MGAKPNKNDDPTVQRVGAIVTDALLKLEPLFKEGSFLTFVSRHPDIPNGELIISSDTDYAEVARLLTEER